MEAASTPAPPATPRHPLDVRNILDAPDRWVDAAIDKVADTPVRWALITAFTALVIGGIAFSLAEPDTTVLDGIWWAFVSMTTVGYGDIAPKTPGIRVIASGVIATGIASTAILTAALAGRIAERRIVPYNETPELTDDFDHIIDELKALKNMVGHPKVEAALREVDEERRRQG